MIFEPGLDLKSSIILFGILQAILLGGIFLKDGIKSPSALLGIVMLVLAAIEYESFLNYTGWITDFAHWENISPPLILTLGPLLLLYTKRIFEMSTGKFYVLHFVPGALFFLYSFFFYFQPSAYKIFVAMKDAHPEIQIPRVAQIFSVDPLGIRGWIIVEGMSLHLFAYVVGTLVVCFRKSERPAAAWPKFLSINLLTGSILFMLTGGTVNGHVLFHPILPGVVVNIYCTVLVYSISAYWLYRIALPGLQRKKYAKAEVPYEIREQKLMRIKEIMELEKPFKESDFNLDTLSRRMSLSSHHLSQIINTGTGMSFLEFINLYRVNEAQRILKTPALRDIKVEALAHEVGYQSKSAFFNAFRRITQTTPARYRDDSTTWKNN
jgi:AraC-like DNA-binding protein